jgi:hypothetical protein
MWEDHSLEEFYIQTALQVSKFSLHLKETEIGSDRHTLWMWFMKKRRCGTQISRTVFKEKAWPYIKRMANECTFIWFKLK